MKIAKGNFHLPFFIIKKTLLDVNEITDPKGSKCLRIKGTKSPKIQRELRENT